MQVSILIRSAEIRNETFEGEGILSSVLHAGARPAPGISTQGKLGPPARCLARLKQIASSGRPRSESTAGQLYLVASRGASVNGVGRWNVPTPHRADHRAAGELRNVPSSYVTCRPPLVFFFFSQYSIRVKDKINGVADSSHVVNMCLLPLAPAAPCV